LLLLLLNVHVQFTVLLDGEIYLPRMDYRTMYTVTLASQVQSDQSTRHTSGMDLRMFHKLHGKGTPHRAYIKCVINLTLLISLSNHDFNSFHSCNE